MRFLVVIALALAWVLTGEWRVRPAATSGTGGGPVSLAGLQIGIGTKAHAQQRRKRRSLLRALFGRREVRRRTVRPRRAQPRRATRRKARRKPRQVRRVRRTRPAKRRARPRRKAAVARSAPAAAAAAAAATSETVEKQENARKVLVVGDFFADGLAWT